MLIDLERAALDTPDKINPFLNSLNLVIMGRDVIVIRFFNQPKFCYSRKIFNYRNDRNDYYNTLTTKLGLDNIPMRAGSNEDNVEFGEDMTNTELAYCNFRIAYESIFLYKGEDLIFEGEKIMANRGAEQFASLIEKWRKTAKLDFSFSRPFS